VTRRERIAILLAGALATVPEAALADARSEYLSAALQGNLRAYAERYGTADPAEVGEDEAVVAARFRDRFLTRGEELPLPDEPFVADVVRTYRDYWVRALLRESAPDEAEDRLLDELEQILVRQGRPAPATAADVLEAVGQEIDAAGFFHIGGRTRPHLELMLWARQDTTRYDVSLTDGTRPVTVVFVGDFLVKGWAHFATFGRASTGGWATRDALFCLVDDYDLESERFRVSYLRHETRHFADYELFPALEQTDLEYRGKLTELIFARDSLYDLLAHFAAAGSPNPDAPHAYANFAVMRDMSREVFGEELVQDGQRWPTVDEERIHAAARTLLERSTRALEADGAETTRGVVVDSAR